MIETNNENITKINKLEAKCVDQRNRIRRVIIKTKVMIVNKQQKGRGQNVIVEIETTCNSLRNEITGDKRETTI